MKKIYFVSDSHLGVPDHASSLIREKKLVRWLDMVAGDASDIYLLGDIFYFWFEYRTVVPKGFVRLLGKIAEMVDLGITIHYFTGNHDMWVFDYFEEEIGLVIHRHSIEVTLHKKKLHIAHGDGLGPGDHGYKWIKRIFSNRMCQRLFSFLHPGIGTGLALYLSRRSRIAKGHHDSYFRDGKEDSLVTYSKDLLQSRPIDFFVFGHRHDPVSMEIKPGVLFINTGDWVNHFTYAVLDEGSMTLKYFKET